MWEDDDLFDDYEDIPDEQVEDLFDESDYYGGEEDYEPETGESDVGSGVASDSKFDDYQHSPQTV